MNADDCDENAKCNNTIGSYLCECTVGYSGNGTYCTGLATTFSKKVDNFYFLQILMSVLRKHTVAILMLSAPTILVVTTALVQLDILGMDSIVVSTLHILCACSLHSFFA